MSRFKYLYAIEHGESIEILQPLTYIPLFRQVAIYLIDIQDEDAGNEQDRPVCRAAQAGIKIERLMKENREIRKRVDPFPLFRSTATLPKVHCMKQ
jgi:hypothetical protein